MSDFLSYLFFFAMLIFAWDQMQKSIARRTADEIERRSKPKPPPKPKSKTRLMLEQIATGAFGALAVGLYVAAIFGIGFGIFSLIP